MLLLWRAAMAEGRDARPFLLSLCFFVLGFAGLVLGIWPYIVPPSLTIWQAASPPSPQGFVLVGLVTLLPVILGYTWWSYRVFAGKVAADSGYQLAPKVPPPRAFPHNRAALPRDARCSPTSTRA